MDNTNQFSSRPCDKFTMTFVEFASGFDTLEDRRTYLQHHPELLSEQAIQAANAFILDWRDKGYVKSTLTHMRMFRNLLKRAMEVGVENAFVEVEPSREVTAAIAALLRPDSGYDLFRTLFVNRKSLTSPQAVGAFNFLRAKFEDDPEQLRRVEASWDAIGVFRNDAKITDPPQNVGDKPQLTGNRGVKQ